jgi:hypothetical protein
MKKRICESCRREFNENEVEVRQSIGPTSCCICEECQKNHCFPIHFFENEVRDYKNVKGGRVKEFRDWATVYENGKYINVEKWLCINEERLIKKYLTMEKEELIENIINGRMSLTNPVTIFNGKIIFVNESEFNAIFNKVNENNWANKEEKNCNTIIVGRFVIIKDYNTI